MGNRYDILTSEPSVNLPDYSYVLAAEEIIKKIEEIRNDPQLSTRIHHIQYSELKKLLEYHAFINGKNAQYNEVALNELNTWLVSLQNSFSYDTGIHDDDLFRSFRNKIPYDFVGASRKAAAMQEIALQNLSKSYWYSEPQDIDDSKNPMPTLQKIVEAWRAFHIARLAVVRSFSVHKKENDTWGENEDLIVDYHDEDIIETAFVAASLTYLCVFLLVAINYYKNKEKLTELERARMQFEMWDAIVWFGINVFRLSGSGALNIDTQGQDDDAKFDLGMTLDVNMGLLLMGYLFDLVNQLIYDLRQLHLMNQKIDKLTGERNSLDTTSTDPNIQNQIKVYNTAIAELETKRDAFTRRSVFSNVFYALGLSSGAVCNLVGAGSAGFVFAATPIGIVLIFLSTFLNQSKNWYVAIQDWKDVAKKSAKQHAALLELNSYLNGNSLDPATQNRINNTLIEAGLCPLNEKEFSSPISIRNYRIIQYTAISAEMHAANNKVMLYSYWFSMILTSMTCLAFASTLIGLVVFVAGGLIYSGLKHTGLVSIEPTKNIDKISKIDKNSTSKMFLAYAQGKSTGIVAPQAQAPVSQSSASASLAGDRMHLIADLSPPILPSTSTMRLSTHN